MVQAMEKIARINRCTSIRMKIGIMDDKAVQDGGFIKDVKAGFWRNKHHLVRSKSKSKSRGNSRGNSSGNFRANSRVNSSIINSEKGGYLRAQLQNSEKGKFTSIA